MNELQIKTLDIYKRFLMICENHNLSFFGIGGTCIGAVRHRGYIPWDDDIDVAMPYPDYLLFISLSKKELGNQYELFYDYDYYIKMCDRETAFITKRGKRYYYKGIGIDIFPIYGMKKGKKRQNLLARKNDFYLKMYNKLGSSYKSGITLKSKIAWLFYESLRLFPGQRYWANRSKRLFSKIPYNCSDKVLFGWRRLPSLTNHYQCVFNIKDFSSFIELPFEDTIMRVPVGYDNYLIEDFGDYMSLPPVEERVSAHSALVEDLHNSYKCYHYNSDKHTFELN